MSAYNIEKVLSVHHWTDNYFSFTCTRDESLRFDSGQFVMVALQVKELERPIARAYSIASANWEDHLEFFSIKVQNGALTSRLQHLKVNDEVLISRKPTGTLVLSDLKPGKNLYLFATGTGIAPFLSLTKDPEAYEQFEKIILVHGVRNIADLAYHDHFTIYLRAHEYLGDIIKNQLIYYPIVSRESFKHQGRITTLMSNGQLFQDIGLPVINPEYDRAMICGSPTMLKDISTILNQLGLKVSPKRGQRGDYLIERAFVE
ncbi:MAG: ferredoxin--NADP reductase [Neisseriaceae bacterium]|nr:MAG: ferredoxin--NADP reductase [Neisseriaceae bacterium]